MPVKDIVAENQRAAIGRDEIPANQEGLGQAL